MFHALVCVLLWSFIAVVARLGQRDMDSFQFLFWSNVLSVISVFIASRMSGKKHREMLVIPWTALRHAAILGSLDGMFYLLLYRGYSIENGVAVLVAQYTWPLMLVALTVIMFRQPLRYGQFFGLALGFAAVGLILTQGHFTRITVAHPQALVLVLAGALCFALLSVLSRLFSLEAYTGTFWLFIFSTLISLVLLACFSHFAWPSGKSILALLLNGILINGLSYIMWIKAMATGNPTRIAPLVFLSPVLSTLWLILFFGDAFVPIYALGVLLAVASGLLCTVMSKAQQAV